MDIDELVLVSVDDHVVEPPGMFDAHLPAKWRDVAPRMVRRDDGTDVRVRVAQMTDQGGDDRGTDRFQDQRQLLPLLLGQQGDRA